MNADRINQLADDLDKVQEINPDKFRMSVWGYGMLRNIPAIDSIEDPTVSADDRIDYCETAGCIAGWAALLYGKMHHTEQPSAFAKNHLELDANTANTLFTPPKDDGDGDAPPDSVIYSTITAGMAAKVLRHLATTEEVDWNQAYS